MSQQEDDLRALAKIMDFLRAVSIVLVAANLYWFTRVETVDSGWFYSTVYKICANFDRTCELFSTTFNAKLFALMLLALSCFGTKGVKNEKITWRHIGIAVATGTALFLLNWWMPALGWRYTYIVTTVCGYVCLLMGGIWIGRRLKNNMMDDRFNDENESFMQETRLLENEYSVNLPTKFYCGKKMRRGWINVVNPFRATIVLGTPGSGKSYAVINSFIKQQIEKGFAAYIYDFKYPDLSTIAYNHLLMHRDGYGKVKPKFYVINFDDPERSHRCNPIHPDFMTVIADAYESSYTIMMNLNRTWVQKQGDFFVESPIVLFAAIIYFLKIYKDGIYCTFPHAIELFNRRYEDLFPILTSYPELENYLSPFMDAWQEIGEKIKTIAATNANAIIFGESGTGKEQVARQIYLHSSREQKPCTVLEAGGAALVGKHDPTTGHSETYNRIAALESERKSFNKGRGDSEFRLQTITHDIANNEAAIARMKADWERYDKAVQRDKEGNPVNNLTIGSCNLSDEKNMGIHLQGLAQKTDTHGLYQRIGEIYGFPVSIISERVLADGVEKVQNRFVVEGSYKYKYNNGQLAMADTHAACMNFVNALERIPGIIAQYEKRTAKLKADVPILEGIMAKTWGKEDELKQLKSELAALDRKIAAELAPKHDEKDGEEVKPDTQQPGKVVEVTPSPQSQSTDDKKSMVAEPQHPYTHISHTNRGAYRYSGI